MRLSVPSSWLIRYTLNVRPSSAPTWFAQSQMTLRMVVRRNASSSHPIWDTCSGFRRLDNAHTFLHVSSEGTFAQTVGRLSLQTEGTAGHIKRTIDR